MYTWEFDSAVRRLVWAAVIGFLVALTILGGNV